VVPVDARHGSGVISKVRGGRVPEGHTRVRFRCAVITTCAYWHGVPAIHRHLLALNERASADFVAAESARARHRALHPTPLAAVKCMDGRVLFPKLTGTPVGLVQPFRAIGGRPELYWPSFMGRLRHWVEEAREGGHRCVLFLTYHQGASDPHLGCAGFDYDTASARAHAFELAHDLGWVFGEQLEPIVAGIETDLDRLVLHGPSGDVDAGALLEGDAGALEQAFIRAFPSMDPAFRRDLVPLMAGNVARVRELRAHPSPRTIARTRSVWSRWARASTGFTRRTSRSSSTTPIAISHTRSVWPRASWRRTSPVRGTPKTRRSSRASRTASPASIDGRRWRARSVYSSSRIV
jgi:hypothetical protein